MTLTSHLRPDDVSAEALDELRELVAEYPKLAAEMPLCHLAALSRCSDDAIELAETMTPEQVRLGESIEHSRTTSAQIEMPAEIGALAQWRAEVAGGSRRKSDIDALARAAIHEANARDELRDRLRAAARGSRLRAAELIVEAVAEHAT